MLNYLHEFRRALIPIMHSCFKIFFLLLIRLTRKENLGQVNIQLDRKKKEEEEKEDMKKGKIKEKRKKERENISIYLP